MTQTFERHVGLLEQPVNLSMAVEISRSVFDPEEVKVLPIALSVIGATEDVYAVLERLPDSLTMAILRLRARGLADVQIGLEHLTKLADELIDLIARNSEDSVYEDEVLASFKNANEVALTYVVDRVTSLLNTGNGFVPGWAASALGKLGGSQALHALLKTLGSGDSGPRMESAFALGRFNDAEAVDALRRTLAKDDEEPGVRWAAASSLGKIASGRAAKELLAVLRSEDASIRWTAAEALWNIDREQVVAGLEAMVNNGSSPAHSAVAFAMGRSDELIEILTGTENSLDDRARAASALGTLKAVGAVDHLFDALLGEQIELRRSASSALGAIGKSGESAQPAIHALVKALKAEDNDIRWRAAWELGKTLERLPTLVTAPNCDSTVVEGLIATLRDTNYSGARWRAAEALGKIGGDKAQNALIELLENHDQDTFVARSVALALGWLRVHDGRVVEECFKAMKDRDSLVRWRAAEALGKIGHAAAVPLLLEALQDNLEVREPAARALGAMTFVDLAEGLLRALDHDDDFVRRKALQVIGYYNSSQQALVKVTNLAESDPVEDVRNVANDARLRILFKRECTEI